MTDLQIGWQNNIGSADLCIVGADLGADDGLETAVLISLFTDARVTEEELPPGVRWQRGWWGSGLNTDGRQLGSKLWTLRRGKATQENLVKARDYAREALAWLLADGVATAVDVDTAYSPQGWLLINVGVSLPDDTRREFQFSDAP